MTMLLRIDDRQRRMLLELVSGHATNLAGHRKAIDEAPELAVVAGDGYAEIGAQLEVANSLLEQLLG